MTRVIGCDEPMQSNSVSPGAFVLHPADAPGDGGEDCDGVLAHRSTIAVRRTSVWTDALKNVRNALHAPANQIRPPLANFPRALRPICSLAHFSKQFHKAACQLRPTSADSRQTRLTEVATTQNVASGGSLFGGATTFRPATDTFRRPNRARSGRHDNARTRWRRNGAQHELQQQGGPETGAWCDGAGGEHRHENRHQRGPDELSVSIHLSIRRI